jgi:DNA-binding response OmpR family regulator
MSTRLLLVEDDPNLGFIVKDNLEDRGYQVTLCENGAIAEEILEKEKFDLLLLDVMLPKKDGFSIAEDIRAKNIKTPIIFMTAREMLEDKIRGFRAGADDYITKPFEFEELFMRIEAVLNRHQQMPESEAEPQPLTGEYTIGKFRLVSPELKLIKEDGETFTLTKKEAGLLEYMARRMNQPVKREDILMSIWKDDSYFAGRSMDVYITKLRKYLKNDPQVEIQNVHGVGFKLSVTK